MNAQIVDAYSSLAGNIELCQLNPLTKVREVQELCSEAKRLNVPSVRVLPWYVSLAASLLRNSQVEVCTTIGLSDGSSSTPAKGAEAREAVRNGAKLIDVNLNLAAVRKQDLRQARNDLEEVMAMTNYAKPRFWLRLDNNLRSAKEQELICRLALLVKVDGIHISQAGPASQVVPAGVDQVKRVRALLGNSGTEIKISGGIENLAQELVAAGASRIGLNYG